MITVCIFTLRKAMKSVQTAFKIPAYGVRHKIPDMERDIITLSGELSTERIQQYQPDRPNRDHTVPVRDLLAEGSKYAHSRGAFQAYQHDSRRARVVNSGTEGMEQESEETQTQSDRDISDSSSEIDDEHFEVETDDLAYGEEDSFYDILQVTMDMVEGG